MRCVCENCGKVKIFEDGDGPFNAGWDWPPRMGFWGIVSARTCGDPGCNITTSVWSRLNTKEENPPELTQHQRDTIERIVLERYLQEGAWEERFDDPAEVRSALVWYIGEDSERKDRLGN